MNFFPFTIPFSYLYFQVPAGAVLSATTVTLPPEITTWGLDLLNLLGLAVGLPADSKIKVVIRYGDNGTEDKLDGSRRGDWGALRDAGPTDTIIIIPPPPDAPLICFCEHADCADAPPGFPTIQKFEHHHLENHSTDGRSEDETVVAIFKPTEDALTPAWRKKGHDSFENKRIRWEQAAHIANAIIPVSTTTSKILFIYFYFIFHFTFPFLFFPSQLIWLFAHC